MKTPFFNFESVGKLVSRYLKTIATVAVTAVALLCFHAVGAAQSKETASPDLTKQPALYLVGYAHLDTQWRWEYPQVISEYLPKTMHLNFDLFQKYPHYIFNFTGANRYMMMKEYYPADYARIKHYVAVGRWYPAGSSMEEGDVNSPSPESIIRQVLYGNEFFRHEFGKASAEYMLPDCFGFPASLPSILAYTGVKGFSTQKLTWGSSAPVGGPNSPEDTPEGTPFNVGLWTGPDGKSVIAALNPESYGSEITYDLTKSINPAPKGEYYVDWPKRVERDGKVSGLYVDYHYFGTGDTGGSPDETSVKLLEAILTKSTAVLPSIQENEDNGEARVHAPASPPVKVGDGPLTIVSSNADQMFLDILKSGHASGLPTYKGDLELTNHSAGSLTSEAVHKRWNRRNEVLADAAERASIAAEWLGGRPYPQQRFNNAWRLVMGGQFHDLMAGTATPQSYEYTWNDDILAMNQFVGALTSATEAVASGLDTQTSGTPIVVYNPLSISRQDVVEASLTFPDGVPQAVHVIGPDGKEVPSQVEDANEESAKVVFLASAPSVGFAVYDIEPANAPAKHSPLKVTDTSLENARYRITLDKNGDVANIFDKMLNRELLSGPARLAFQSEKPSQWPAWNMDWADQQKPPRDYVSGPAQVRIAENGPARVALEVTREAEGSRFVQTICLSAGDAGNRVEFVNAIDWMSKEAALKATFPLTASNPEATYNWGVGTIQRGNNDPKKFEVASHRWFDLTDKSGDYGVAILSGAKTGSDKPTDNMLRLTLIYTPGISENGRDYGDQATQDWGHHEFVYGLAGHAGDWRQEQTDWQAYRLNDPLIAFESSKHDGTLGKSFSLLTVSNPNVRVMAVKKAEDSNEIVVRAVEMSGQPQQSVRVAFAAPVIAAREVNGQEQLLGNAPVTDGAVVADFSPYQIRSFALNLASPPARIAAPQSQPVELHYDLAAATDNGAKSEYGGYDGEKSQKGGFDTAGDALPAEMLPDKLMYSGIRFNLGPAWSGRKDAVVARGQTIALPQGNFNRVYIIAASADGDQKATFQVGGKPVELNIQNWTGFIGQWYDRNWKQVPLPLPAVPNPNDLSRQAQRARRFLAYVKVHGPIMIPEYSGVLTPGFIKTAPVAWFASHHHTAEGANTPYSYSYLFAYPIDLPAGAKTLTLPDNNKIRILAVTVANEAGQVDPVQPLYDIMASLPAK